MRSAQFRWLLTAVVACAAGCGAPDAGTHAGDGPGAVSPSRAVKGTVLATLDIDAAGHAGDYVYGRGSEGTAIALDLQGNVPPWLSDESGDLLNRKNVTIREEAIVATGDQKGSALAVGAAVIARLDPATGKALWTLALPDRFDDLGSVGSGLVEVRLDTEYGEGNESLFVDLTTGQSLFTLEDFEIVRMDPLATRPAPAAVTAEPADSDGSADPEPTIPPDIVELRDPRTGAVREKVTLREDSRALPGHDDFARSAGKLSRVAFDGAVKWSVATDGRVVGSNDGFVVVEVESTDKIVVLDAGNGAEHLVLDIGNGAPLAGCDEGVQFMTDDRLLLECELDDRDFTTVVQL